jgi:hypothetical protein
VLKATPACLARSRWLSSLRLRKVASGVPGVAGPGALDSGGVRSGPSTPGWLGVGTGCGAGEEDPSGSEAGTFASSVYDRINTKPRHRPVYVRHSSGLCIGFVLHLC